MAVVNAGKYLFFVAGSPCFNQVFGGVNFIVKNKRKHPYYIQVKLWAIQSLC